MDTVPYLESYRSSANLVVLESETVKSYPLELKKKWTIGRTVPGKAPDISFTSKIVSREHGQITNIDGDWYYKDKGSFNGTYYNGIKLKKEDNGETKAVKLKNGDVLRVDSTDLNTPESRGVWMLYSTECIGNQWRAASLKEEKTVFGRDKNSADVVIPRPYVSAKHFIIEKKADGNYITDLDSMAGTWLNGERIYGSHLLREKDMIAICNSIMIYTENNVIYNIPVNDMTNRYIKDETNNNNVEGGDVYTNKPVVLKADIKSRKVQDESGHGQKELIKDIQVEIQEGTLVALLGGAGAGKSTVMNCLDGFEYSGMDGVVELYGVDFIKNYARMKHLVGVIEQSNRFHPNAVVENELQHAAVHRLPKDTTKEEIKERVDYTLKQLGIDNVRKNKICKCSGGEQKRVNIGIELVADRSFLFMDEPDAGLDPGNKRKLFELLRKLAHEDGKTILTIIHDVSDIELFDSVLIMNKVDNVGRLAFFGSPEEGKNHFGVELKDVYSLMAANPEKYIWENH